MGTHCWWWGPGYFFGAPWNMAFGMLFWVLVIIAIFWVVASASRRVEPDRKRPVDILKERYAKGEIDQVEFEHKKHELEA
jgi:putative membrane protein